MAVSLVINDENRTSNLLAGSLNIGDEINNRNTCSFELEDTSYDWTPDMGSKVVIYDDGIKVFAGTIDDLAKKRPPGTSVLRYAITCVDFNQLCDRKLVNQVYVNKTTGYIVNSLLVKYLASEGITGTFTTDPTTTIQGGPIIEKAVFSYRTVADCLDELGKLSGFKWNIDYDKVLHWFDRQTYEAPFSIMPGKPFRNFSIRRTREQYRNRQYVRGGTMTTDPRTETFKGNGQQKTFTLAYPVDTVSGIKVGSVDQIYGPRGTNLAGLEWTYSRGAKEIVVGEGKPALADGAVLSVSYVGTFPIISVNTLDDQVADRKDVEGGTGLYEDIEYDESVEKDSQAEQKSTSLLTLYGKIPTIIDFQTEEAGFKAGQTVHVELPQFGLDKDFLIHRVSIDSAGSLGLRYNVSAVGSEAPVWKDYFQGLAKGKRLTIREDEYLLILKTLKDNVGAGDSEGPTWSYHGQAFLVSPDTMVGFAEVSDATYSPMTPGQYTLG